MHFFILTIINLCDIIILMKKYKSKVLNLYRKQKFLNLLSVKLLLPITALFLAVMTITGITIAIGLKNFSLGGLFAGLGLSVSIASLVYILVNADDDYFFKTKLKNLSQDMEKAKEENLFETQIYKELQFLTQQKDDYKETKSLVQELIAKLKQQKENSSENNEDIEQLKQERLNLVKQKTMIKQQEKEIFKLEKQYTNKNKRIQQLNPDLDVEYLGCEK